MRDPSRIPDACEMAAAESLDSSPGPGAVATHSAGLVGRLVGPRKGTPLAAPDRAAGEWDPDLLEDLDRDQEADQQQDNAGPFRLVMTVNLDVAPEYHVKGKVYPRPTGGLELEVAIAPEARVVE